MKLACAFVTVLSFLIHIIRSHDIEIDVFVGSKNELRTLTVNLQNDNIQEKATSFVNEHNIMTGAGCYQDKPCVIKKITQSLEYQAIETLSPNLIPSSTILIGDDSLFSNAGWHSDGNPFSENTPLFEIEARSSKRIISYQDNFLSLNEQSIQILENLKENVANSLDQSHETGFNLVELAGNDSINGKCTSLNNDSHGIVLAIGVITGPKNIAHRMAIRHTWVSTLPEKYRSIVAVKFFIGLSFTGNSDNSHKEVHQSIMSEALVYGDIGILHLDDHYLSTPKKAIALFKWGVEKCGAYYVLRSNDDVYLRLEQTLQLLSNSLPSNLMMGYLIQGKDMFIPRPETYNMTQEEIFEKHKGWTFTLSDYPSNIFPDFLQGNAMILTRDLAYEIAQISTQPNFRLMADDIMIALITSKFKPQVLSVNADYELHGLYTACHDDALWHFNLHPEHMYDLFHNELFRRNPCEGIARFCCG